MSTAARRVLIVCTRRNGDVLLATPLARSFKRAWPEAAIEMLVFHGTEGVLEGNPDLAAVHIVPPSSRLPQRLAELRSLWRRYDLAAATIASDRARIYGWAAARARIGCLAPGESASKRRLLDRWVPFDDLDTHTVAMVLRLADLAGVPRCYEVVAPTAGGALAPELSGVDYAVLHPFPKFNYKMWHIGGWVELAAALAQCGLKPVLSGGPDAAEQAYAQHIAERSGALSLAGRLSLAQTADLLRGARLCVATDTAAAHLAAAVAVPTVALFGPSNPVKWGPWPVGRSDAASPWARVGSARRGNVFLLQGEAECVPCMLEGCERHVASFSRCLQELPARRVIDAALAMLEPG